MKEDKKTLDNVQKGESLKRIADALEHIAYYLAIIVNKNAI